MSKEGYSSNINAKDGENLYWTTDMKKELPVRMEPRLVGNEILMTIPERFIEAANEFHYKDALLIERKGQVLKWTWSEYHIDVIAFAKAMYKLGINERSSVNIMAANGPEWFISFMGGVFYNCVSAGVYPTNNADACVYQA